MRALAIATLIASLASVWAAPAAAASAVLAAKVKQRLQTIGPLSGRFVQTTPGGAERQGMFWLDLPRYARFAYRAAPQSIVTLRGNWLVVQDAPRAEANRFPVSATPLVMLRYGAKQLVPEAIIAEHRSATQAAVTLADPQGDVAGQLTLHFALPDWRLTGWQVRDAQNLTTTVALRDVQRHDSLSPRLFDIEEDESEE